MQRVGGEQVQAGVVTEPCGVVGIERALPRRDVVVAEVLAGAGDAGGEQVERHGAGRAVERGGQVEQRRAAGDVVQAGGAEQPVVEPGVVGRVEAHLQAGAADAHVPGQAAAGQATLAQGERAAGGEEPGQAGDGGGVVEGVVHARARPDQGDGLGQRGWTGVEVVVDGEHAIAEPGPGRPPAQGVEAVGVEVDGVHTSGPLGQAQGDGARARSDVRDRVAGVDAGQQRVEQGGVERGEHGLGGDGFAGRGAGTRGHGTGTGWSCRSARSQVGSGSG